MCLKTVLSILSHVVHGYVGNRATVFPLQFAGWDVDAVNTTHFSNHPGYGTFKGSASTPQLIDDILTGLEEAIGTTGEYDMVLTGYTPNDEVLEVIFERLTATFQKASVPPVWVLDPVLGDNGKLYVLEKVVPVYKRLFSSGYVTLTTPNQFEFELLSGTKITDWASVSRAFEQFNRAFDVRNVVLSSVIIEDAMYCVGFSGNKKQIFYFPIQQINCNFNGCGDLFTALLANAFYNNDSQLSPQVLSDVLVKLNKILQHSYECEQRDTGMSDIKLVKDIRIVPLRHLLLLDNGNELINRVKFI